MVKSLAQRVSAALCAAAMFISTAVGSVPVSAAEGTYKINGLAITDSSGVSQGRGLCLDYQQSYSRGGDEYTRVKLSELTSYTKAYQHREVNLGHEVGQLYTKAPDGKEKGRIIKCLVEQDKINSYASQIGFPSNGSNPPVASLVWLFSYNENQWNTFRADAHESFTAHMEESGLNSSSLWNYYSRMVSYVDTLPDYMGQGYDAWVYLTAATDRQNVLSLIPIVKTVDVTFRKISSKNLSPVSGAVFQIKNSSGQVINTWTTNGADYKLSLEDNSTYTVHEVTAPSGYKALSNDAIVTLKNGKLTAQNAVYDAANNIVNISNTPFVTCSVKITKKDSVTNQPLAGARFQVSETQSGQVIDTWTSTTSEHVLDNNIKYMVRYTVKEISAPSGYIPSPDTDFIWTGNGFNWVYYTADGQRMAGSSASYGEVNFTCELTVYNKPTSINIAKTDANGNPLSGAQFRVTAPNGAEIASWRSTTSAYELKGLDVDTVYTLHEVAAPEGYYPARDVTFVIDRNGKVTSSALKNGTISIANNKTQVSIKKTDADTGDMLSGAVLQVLDNNSNIVDEWTTTAEAHSITGLTVNRTYTLHEEKAPEDYTVADDIRFYINSYGQCIVNGAVVDAIEMQDAMHKFDITISKKDEDDKHLPNAHLVIRNTSTGTIADEWDTGEAHISSLVANKEYEIVEIKIPDGYYIAENLSSRLATFTIDLNGNIDFRSNIGNDASVNGTEITLINRQTKVQISKNDAETGAALSGAEFRIVTENGDTVQEWTSGTTPETIQGLLTNKVYRIIEVSAPDGYTLNTDEHSFVIGDDGKVSSNELDSNGTVVITDKPITINVTKVDAVTNEALEGAVLRIAEKNGGKVFKEWTTTADGIMQIKGLTANREYVLQEVSAPDGYVLAKDIAFTVDEQNNITGTDTTTGSIIMKDEATEVRIAKIDITSNEEIAGAHLQILDGDTIVAEWDSTNEPHRVGKLLTGVEYTIRETVAPVGYTITSDTKFTINADGSVNTDATVTSDGIVLIADGKTSVNVSKVDIATEEELEGAVLQVIENGTVVEEWTSVSEPHTITGLATDTEYVLREITAPDGYTVAKDITFKVTSDGDIITEAAVSADGVILVKDSKTSAYIAKTDENGNGLANAHLVVTNAETGDVADEWDSEETPHEVIGLTAGTVYAVTETKAPDGYLVNTEPAYIMIDAEGKVYYGENTDIEAENNVVNIENKKTAVSFIKVDADTNEALSGAYFEIVDTFANDATISVWTSDEDAHEVTGLSVQRVYKLRELTAPDGYVLGNDIDFVIEEDGTVTTSAETDGNLVYVPNTLTSIKVLKVADGYDKVTLGMSGNMILENARLQIIDEHGVIVDDWVTDGTAHEVKGLIADMVYALHEEYAPEGYNVSPDIKFIINKDGTINTYGTTDGNTLIMVDTEESKPAPEPVPDPVPEPQPDKPTPVEPAPEPVKPAPENPTPVNPVPDTPAPAPANPVPNYVPESRTPYQGYPVPNTPKLVEPIKMPETKEPKEPEIVSSGAGINGDGEIL